MRKRLPTMTIASRRMAYVVGLFNGEPSGAGSRGVGIARERAPRAPASTLQGCARVRHLRPERDAVDHEDGDSWGVGMIGRDDGVMHGGSDAEAHGDNPTRSMWRVCVAVVWR